MTRVLAAVITPPSYRASGGVAAGLELTRHIARIEGLDVEAAIMAETGFEKDDRGLHVRGFRCHNRLGPFRRLLPRALGTTQWHAAIPAYISATRPDLVHLHNPVPPAALWEVAETCLRLGIPYVISSHGFVEMMDFARAFRMSPIASLAVPRLINRPFRSAVAGAERIFMLSPLEAPLLDALGVPANRREVVTNGATIPAVLPNEVRTRLRNQLGLRPEVPLWLFVGNHTANKGIDVLLEAAHRLTVPAQVVVAGGIRSPEAHAALRRAHRVDQLGDRVIFTDFLQDDDLQALYATVDAFVFPSRADTLPLAILDAMANGLPVVATAVGGIPYQVSAETGVLVPVDDADMLAVAMDTLSADPVRRRTLGDGGRRRVRDVFNWATAASVAAAAYAQVLTRPT